jgi:cyclase
MDEAPNDSPVPGTLGRLVDLGRGFFAVVASEDDSVYGGFGANQGFVLLEDSVLVFDSGFSIFQARNLLNKIRELTDKKLRYLVNSHDHSDHVFGNSFFWKRFASYGLRIISHGICRDEILTKGSKRLKSYRKLPGLDASLKSIEVRAPNVVYPDIGIRLEIEGVTMVFSHPPTGAHTLGDTILFFPSDGIAFAGDVVWNRFLPNFEDANLEGWITYLEDLDLDTYQKIVPGHGKVCGRDGVLEFRDYLRQVQSKILDIGLTDASPLDRKSLRDCFAIPGTEDWKFRHVIDHNVDALFAKTNFRNPNALR